MGVRVYIGHMSVHMLLEVLQNERLLSLILEASTPCNVAE